MNVFDFNNRFYQLASSFRSLLRYFVIQSQTSPREFALLIALSPALSCAGAKTPGNLSRQGLSPSFFGFKSSIQNQSQQTDVVDVGSEEVWANPLSSAGGEETNDQQLGSESSSNSDYRLVDPRTKSSSRPSARGLQFKKLESLTPSSSLDESMDKGSKSLQFYSSGGGRRQFFFRGLSSDRLLFLDQDLPVNDLSSPSPQAELGPLSLMCGGCRLQTLPPSSSVIWGSSGLGGVLRLHRATSSEAQVLLGSSGQRGAGVGYSKSPLEKSSQFSASAQVLESEQHQAFPATEKDRSKNLRAGLC